MVTPLSLHRPMSTTSTSVSMVLVSLLMIMCAQDSVLVHVNAVEVHYFIKCVGRSLRSVISSRCRLASPIITRSDIDIAQCDMNSSHSDSN